MVAHLGLIIWKKETSFKMTPARSLPVATARTRLVSEGARRGQARRAEQTRVRSNVQSQGDTNNVYNFVLHSKFMRRALELAETAKGKTFPNPMVGCVIVAEDEIVGEGYHPAAGQPHAEVFALRAAGNKASGATAYVTLEPCNHYGRTPPCSLALVKAGVSKVVVGMVDPNPLVAGSGVETLKDNGIEVIVGMEEQACRDLNADFIKRMENEAKK